MAQSDYDRPASERPVDSTAPPYSDRHRGTWTGPLGIVLAIIFIVLLLMALLG
jgi:hypothetical protein